LPTKFLKSTSGVSGGEPCDFPRAGVVADYGKDRGVDVFQSDNDLSAANPRPNCISPRPPLASFRFSNWRS
jgi:hypothetical protein